MKKSIALLEWFAALGLHQAEVSLDLTHVVLTVSQKCHLRIQRWTSAQANFRPNTVLRQLEVFS